MREIVCKVSVASVERDGFYFGILGKNNVLPPDEGRPFNYCEPIFIHFMYSFLLSNN